MVSSRILVTLVALSGIMAVLYIHNDKNNLQKERDAMKKTHNAIVAKQAADLEDLRVKFTITEQQRINAEKLVEEFEKKGKQLREMVEHVREDLANTTSALKESQLALQKAKEEVSDAKESLVKCNTHIDNITDQLGECQEMNGRIEANVTSVIKKCKEQTEHCTYALTLCKDNTAKLRVAANTLRDRLKKKEMQEIDELVVGLKDNETAAVNTTTAKDKAVMEEDVDGGKTNPTTKPAAKKNLTDTEDTSEGKSNNETLPTENKVKESAPTKRSSAASLRDFSGDDDNSSSEGDGIHNTKAPVSVGRNSAGRGWGGRPRGQVGTSPLSTSEAPRPPPVDDESADSMPVVDDAGN